MKAGKGVAGLLLVGTWVLTGCAGSLIQLPFGNSTMGTYVELDHPLVQKGSGNYAAVYFLRPQTERYMGATDNRLTIDMDKEQLLKLVKSEYTLVHLKAGEMNVTIKSLTIAGPFREFKKMKRTKRFEFEAGETYYISVEPVDGEFRGTYFLPHLVDLAAAKEKSRYMRARGLAKKAPLHGSSENPLFPFWPFI
ncbi:MAG: hypothetical protein COB33_000900 [Thiotrichaceae bacterium]|nr:hypothetical protein [Thiotrichaceae bacterium]